MKGGLEQSVILTGASVSGKSTLHCALTIMFGLIPTPVHTTRQIRSGEVAGVDAVFVSEATYMDLFAKGIYLEESPERAYFGGAYYGSPRDWIVSSQHGKFNCFVCPTIAVARIVKSELSGLVKWIHLTACENVRRDRLRRRNPDLSQEAFERRIKRGSTQVDISGHDEMIDTSFLGAAEILSRAVKALQTRN